MTRTPTARRIRTCALAALGAALAGLGADCADVISDFQELFPEEPDPGRPRNVGSIPEQTLNSGDTISIDVSPYFTDPDGDPLRYTASGSAYVDASMSGSVLTIVGLSTGFRRERMTGAVVGAHDPGGSSSYQTLAITVINPPPRVRAPMPDQTMTAGDTLRFIDLNGYFEDPLDNISYSASSADDGIATAETSVIHLTLVGIAPGETTVTVVATDFVDQEVSQQFRVTVTARSSSSRSSSPLEPGRNVSVDSPG